MRNLVGKQMFLLELKITLYLINAYNENLSLMWHILFSEIVFAVNIIPYMSTVNSIIKLYFLEDL